MIYMLFKSIYICFLKIILAAMFKKIVKEQEVSYTCLSYYLGIISSKRGYTLELG